MAELINFFNTYIDAVAEMIIMFHFFTKCLPAKAKPIHYLVCTALSICILQLLQNYRILQYLFFAILLVAVGIFLYGTKCMRVILYAASTITAMQLCYGVIGSLSMILYSILPTSGTGVVNLVFSIGGNILSLSLSVLCYKIVLKYFALEKTINEQYDILILLIPALTILLAGQYINFAVYGNTWVTDKKSFFETKHFLMLIIQLLGIGSLFCIMFAYKKILANVHMNTKILLLEQETDYLRQYVSEAKGRYEKTTAFRHDIKNHMEIIKELIQKKRGEQALDYLANMEDAAADISFPCHTNNPAADVLLENKLGIANNLGITVSCLLSLPYPCKISDMDFCIILSNAADNAINACKALEKDAPAYIKVSGNIQGDFLLIEIRNSFKSKAAINEGIGLKNIRSVAEKYDGRVNIETTGNEFILSVLLVC